MVLLLRWMVEALWGQSCNLCLGMMAFYTVYI